MNLDLITPLERDGTVNTVIETPEGSSHKSKFRPGLQALALNQAMPIGFVFPFDFGRSSRVAAEV